VNVELLDAVREREVRLWYAERAFQRGGLARCCR
jgi:hypothetical protein